MTLISPQPQPARRDGPLYIDHKHQRLTDRDRPHWLLAVLFSAALLGLTSWTSLRDEEHRHEQARWNAERARMVALDRCPQPAAGYTDVVVLVIRSSADDKPTVTGCSRIAERSFVPRAARNTAVAK